MKLGKMLSVGEVVEDSINEDETVPEPEPAAERVIEETDAVPAPAPVASSAGR